MRLCAIFPDWKPVIHVLSELLNHVITFESQNHLVLLTLRTQITQLSSTTVCLTTQGRSVLSFFHFASSDVAEHKNSKVCAYLCSLQAALDTVRRSTRCTYFRYWRPRSVHSTSVSTAASSVSIALTVAERSARRVITAAETQLPNVPTATRERTRVFTMQLLVNPMPIQHIESASDVFELKMTLEGLKTDQWNTDLS